MMWRWWNRRALPDSYLYKFTQPSPPAAHLSNETPRAYFSHPSIYPLFSLCPSIMILNSSTSSSLLKYTASSPSSPFSLTSQSYARNHPLSKPSVVSPPPHNPSTSIHLLPQSSISHPIAAVSSPVWGTVKRYIDISRHSDIISSNSYRDRYDIT
jgi:hypothetical protein